jgi:hypothetical protein
MAIAISFTMVCYMQIVFRSIRVAYAELKGFVIGKADEEIDFAVEVQHFMIMMHEHIIFLEGGPIMVRIVALLAETFLISEDSE